MVLDAVVCMLVASRATRGPVGPCWLVGAHSLPPRFDSSGRLVVIGDVRARSVGGRSRVRQVSGYSSRLRGHPSKSSPRPLGARSSSCQVALSASVPRS
jgi:hypothetical protein